MMNEYGKSDNSIVPEKSPNKARQRVAEAMEERGLAEGNSGQQTRFRTQGRTDLQHALVRIRQVPRKF